MLNSNFSEIQEIWTDHYLQLKGYLTAKILLGLLILFILAGTTVLYGGMVLFEKFGGDSQKRGLLNQIHSQICENMIAVYWLTLPIAFWRIIVGPIRWTKILWFRSFVLYTGLFRALILALEYFSLKYVTIAWKKRMLSILDDFWAIYLHILNAILSMILALLECYNPSIDDGFTRFSGLPQYLLDKGTPLNYR